jgi:hypothetical protein
MFKHLFKPKPTPEPISHAVDSLRKVIERGTCSKTLPKHIAAIARALEAEAKINNKFINEYLSQTGEL